MFVCISFPILHAATRNAPPVPLFYPKTPRALLRISLNVLSVEISSTDVHSKAAVPVSVASVCLIKIDKDRLRDAVSLFAGKQESAMCTIARDVLEGHQRAVIGYVAALITRLKCC